MTDADLYGNVTISPLVDFYQPTNVFDDITHLIDRSKEIHTALNNPKVRTAPEEDVYRFARGSVVADKDLAAGHVITEADIWARRPGSGEISVQYFDHLIGARLTHAVKRNQQLRWTDFDNLKQPQ
jgi:N-acetylneuraminate synthase